MIISFTPSSFDAPVVYFCFLASVANALSHRVQVRHGCVFSVLLGRVLGVELLDDVVNCVGHSKKLPDCCVLRPLHASLGRAQNPRPISPRPHRCLLSAILVSGILGVWIFLIFKSF